MTTKLYRVTSTMTITVTCGVMASSPDEAMAFAADCEAGSLEDCINSGNSRHPINNVWLAGELDGSADTETMTVREITP